MRNSMLSSIVCVIEYARDIVFGMYLKKKDSGVALTQLSVTLHYRRKKKYCQL